MKDQGTNSVLEITGTEIEFTADDDIDSGIETGGITTGRSGIAIEIS
jgi:hypothetical protein